MLNPSIDESVVYQIYKRIRREFTIVDNDVPEAQAHLEPERNEFLG